MLPLLPLSDSLVLSASLVGVCAILAPALCLERRARRVAAALLMAVVVVLAAALLGWSRGHALGVTVAWSVIPVLAAVALALPVALVLRHAPRLFRRREQRVRGDGGPLLTRRAALALPVCAGAGTAVGFGGERGAELRELGFEVPGLQPGLCGLRILQLSDLHLGTGLDDRDLELILARAAARRPDLVVLTGDTADRLAALQTALPRLASLSPRLGTFAVLGNHEYMSGELEEMIAAYAASGVTLLVNEARTLAVGGATLSVIGVDDPYGKAEDGFFERCLRGADPGPRAGFRLLLSHRPDALDAAAARGIDLVLSGHTHGGQVGWWGRSLFERLGVARRMWGFYRAGATRLYTSAGAGDWFPFRINCPREAPLLTLEERKQA
jgi:predicted MPP superfamily phosphohydrolase